MRVKEDAMSRFCMITTVDNPFDPRTQWDDWLRYDEDHHYFTNNLLARVGIDIVDFPNEVNNVFIEEAIDNIVKYDVLKRFKKIVYEDDKTTS